MQAPAGPTSNAAPTTSRRPYTHCARQPRMTKTGPGWLTHSRRCRPFAPPWTPSVLQGAPVRSRPRWPAAVWPLSRRLSGRSGHQTSKRLKGNDVAARDDGPPQGTGGAVGAGGAPGSADRGQRWLARLAFAGAAAVVAVVLLSGALRSIAVLLLGLAGLAVTCVAAWW